MSGDLISRRKLDGMRLAVPDFINPDARTRGWNECITYIQKMAPAVDAEPVRHGEWIQSKAIPSHHTCSYCKAVTKMIKACNTYYALTKYCPNCGAKMDKKEGE